MQATKRRYIAKPPQQQDDDEFGSDIAKSTSIGQSDLTAQPESPMTAGTTATPAAAASKKITKRQKRKRPLEVAEISQISINCLPADLLIFVFELSVSQLPEVAPLARVSKFFNACMKEQTVVGKLQLNSHRRILSAGFTAAALGFKSRPASTKLTEVLHQVRSGYPTIGGVNLGNASRSFCAYVTDKHVQLVASFPNLKSVSLTRCVSVTNLSPLLSLRALVNLELGYCKSISSKFPHLASLTSLELNNTATNDKGLKSLTTSLTALTKLNLRACRSISGPGFNCLSALASLQELNVMGTHMNDSAVSELSTSAKVLMRLVLRECKSISRSGFACLSSATSLEELDVGYTAIGDQGLEGVSRLTGLKKLKLDSCKLVTGGGFASLSSLTSLRELDVSSTAINDEGLQGVSGSSVSLVALNLHDCFSITPTCFACLCPLKRLRVLNVSATAIEPELYTALMASALKRRAEFLTGRHQN